MPTPIDAQPMLPRLTPSEIRRLLDEHVPVDGMCPEADYVYAIWDGSAMPTDAEVKMLQSYCDYVVTAFYGVVANKRILKENPLPISRGHNTAMFHKGPTKFCGVTGWCYRRNSWTVGPFVIPDTNHQPAPPWTLVQVFDEMETIGGEVNPRWVAWKAERSEIFSASE